MNETIVIIDFGSQYGQLIARRVREHNVYSIICQPSASAKELAQITNLKGIILSGGPASVYAPNAPTADEKIFELGVPILGICYGMQWGCKILGAKVKQAASREYGRAVITITDSKDLFAGVGGRSRSSSA
jgi:GMP synthase (glutamine-hydrolysing)